MIVIVTPLLFRRRFARFSIRSLLALIIATSTVSAVEVEDFEGRTVTLDAPAERIVALAPHVVENLYSAGAGEALVGAVSYSDWPPAARDLPEVGGYTSISLEAVIALDPDLVIAWSEGEGAKPAMVERFESLGIPVYVDTPRALSDIARMIRDFGRLAGTTATAEAIAADFETTLAALEARYAEREPVSVFYQVWDEPLQTLGRDQFVDHVIRLCGGRNIFADTTTAAPRVSIEAVLDRDPEAIVASGMGDARPDWLDDWRDWPGLRAARRDHLYFIPPDIIQRPTVRILAGAARLCQALDSARSDTPDD